MVTDPGHASECLRVGGEELSTCSMAECIILEGRAKAEPGALGQGCE